MRTSNGCTLEQSLTIEATNVVKQAINLSQRRGHAHVTPIHVATVMLASPSGIFQRACLKTHSHPLQYKALELCFNVALNRLPSTTSGPILGSQCSAYPSFSNALVAAFKRAQAHQRRGSIESQQQPILALKIETEQLVVSILDDPSVSRVMREAGFSSTSIKDNVEKVVSLEVSHSSIRTQYSNQQNMTPLIIPLDHGGARNEDVLGVVSSLFSTTTKKRKNTVVVGECVGNCESVVRAVKVKIERGDEIRNAKFLSLDLMSIKNFSREEIEVKLSDLRSLLKGDVVLYLGDLKWVCEYWGFYGEQRRSFYCPIEHMVTGIRGICYENNSIQTLRVLAIANFSSYIKCKTGNPSLETLLDLQPLAIPFGSLDFSLKLDSTVLQGEKKSVQLSCCSDCSANFDRESRYLGLSGRKMENTASSLPTWLQKCKEESLEESMSYQKDEALIKELCKKWNSICSSIHKTISFSTPSIHSIFESKWPSKEHNFFSMSDLPKPDLLSNPNSTPNSASSSEATEPIMEFKDNTNENLEAICTALEKAVPWQKEIIPEIARTVLKCRAGLMERKGKHETWMMFLGEDDDGKVKVAKELANLVFGSRSSFKFIAKSSPMKVDSRSKRGRDESDYLERLCKEIHDDPHRVFYVEDVDHMSEKIIKKAIETGVMTLNDGESVALEDAIVVFSLSSSSRGCCSPSTKQKLYHGNNGDYDGDQVVSPCVSLDLNLSINDDHSDDEISILECVDTKILFKLQML